MIFTTPPHQSKHWGLLVVLCLSFNSTVLAKSLIDYTFEAAYQVFLNDQDLGYTRISLTKTNAINNIFELKSNAKTAGFIGLFQFNSLSERSKIQLTKNGMRTLSYQYTHKFGDNFHDQYTVNMDYSKKIATRGGKFSKTWKVNRPLVSDRLSFSFMLADDLRRNKPLRNPMVILDGYHALMTKVRYVGSSKEKSAILHHYKFINNNKNILSVSLKQREHFIPYSIAFTNNRNGDTLTYKLKSVVWTEIESL